MIATITAAAFPAASLAPDHPPSGYDPRPLAERKPEDFHRSCLTWSRFKRQWEKGRVECRYLGRIRVRLDNGRIQWHEYDSLSLFIRLAADAAGDREIDD